MPELTLVDLVLVALAGAAAGLINALAGGGTLISFPVLTALGVPAADLAALLEGRTRLPLSA